MSTKSKYNLYDELVAECFSRLISETAQSSKIAIVDFDPKNEEHLFVLGVAKGASSVVTKQIALDVAPWRLAQMNKGLTSEQKIARVTDEDYPISVNAKELVAILRMRAIELFETDCFDFGEIYREYYHVPSNKKRRMK